MRDVLVAAEAFFVRAIIEPKILRSSIDSSSRPLSLEALIQPRFAMKRIQNFASAAARTTTPRTLQKSGLLIASSASQVFAPTDVPHPTI